MTIVKFKSEISLIVLFFVLFCNLSHADIFVKDKSMELGIINYNETKKVETYIVNQSESPLTIKKIMKACACAKIDLSSKIIQAGKKAKVTLFVKPGSLKGKFTKKIYFVTDRKSPWFLSLSISGIAKQFYSVTPSEFIYLGSVTADTSPQRTLTITTVDKAKWGTPTISPAGSAEAAITSKKNNPRQEYSINQISKQVKTR